MKAIAKTGPSEGVTLLEVEIPSVGPHDILVAVAAAGICGSDLSISLWKEGYRHLPLPMILGHEFSGKVVRKGSEVKGVSEGDRVAVNPVIPCGQCPSCSEGSPRDCEGKTLLGFTKDGCFASHISVPEEASLFRLPDSLSDDAGALIEPFAVAYHAIEVSQFQSEKEVAILGMGPIGLMMTGLLRQLGAGKIMITGRSPRKQRIDIAFEMGADEIVDICEKDPIKVAKEMTGGKGLDLVFEATGNPSALPQGLEMIRRGGEMVLVGIFEGKGEIKLTEFVRGNKRLIGSHAYDCSTWQRVIDLLTEGKIPAHKIVTHKLPLRDGLHAFDLAASREGVKVLLDPRL